MNYFSKMSTAIMAAALLIASINTLAAEDEQSSTQQTGTCVCGDNACFIKNVNLEENCSLRCTQTGHKKARGPIIGKLAYSKAPKIECPEFI